MLFIAHHGFRTGGFNPTHTDAGLAQMERIVQFLHLFDVSVILSGEGERFIEFALLLRQAFGTAAFGIIPFLGRATSFTTIRGKRMGIIGPTKEFPEKDFIKLNELKSFDPWKFLKEDVADSYPGCQVISSGREFLSTLGRTKTASASLYEVDVRRQKTYALIERGRPLLRAEKYRKNAHLLHR